MSADATTGPDNTAVRTALWRALHGLVDAPPHVLDDQIGLRLVAPDEGWRQRPDMDPNFTSLFRASIVARARFIEDLVTEQVGNGVDQYIILGAGLDSFAQRRPDTASRLNIFEIDRPGTQAWKRRRLIELAIGVPDWLHLVPVDFEAGDAWPVRLAAAGFDATRPALFAATGVSMYLSKEAIAAMLREVAGFARGSTLAMTFLLPMELAAPELRPGYEASTKGARAAGTPFLSFFAPDQIVAMARDCGFTDARHVSAATLNQRYFAGRTDGLHTVSGEELLVATI